MDSKKVQISLQLPGELRKAAMAKAQAEDVTLSQVIRWWLKAWVDGYLPTRPTEGRGNGE